MPREPQNFPEPILQFLKEKNWEVQGIIKNPRHFIIRVSTPDSQDPVLLKVDKAASRASLQQRNHVLWTKSVARTIPKDASFHVAPILDAGTIGGTWYWFTMPFIEGKPFAEMDDDYLSRIAVDQPEEILSRIVSLMKHIEKTPARSANGIDARYGVILERKDKLEMLETSIRWARNDTPFLAELLQLIQANYVYLGLTNAHGDFTDVNLMINNKREPVLIDAEISNAREYKYYDAAEFYNRLYTRSCAPELAQKFLEAYVQTLPSRSVQKFLNNFLCLSALRAIGNFMEIGSLAEGNGKQKRLDYAARYAEAIVTYNILQIDT